MVNVISGVQLICTIGYYFITLCKAMENSLKRSKSHICSAMLKYGHYNFSLTILEYCSPDKCLEREDYYLKLFKPEYNIAQDPSAPFSGRKHSDESKIIMSPAKKINNPGSFKPGENNPNYGKKVEGAGKPSQAIEVTDITNDTTTSYDSIREAARALDIRSSSIDMYFKNNQKKKAI